MFAAALLFAGLAFSQNASEIAEAVGGDWGPLDASDLAAYADLARLQPTQLDKRDTATTALPEIGVAAQLGPNETHVYAVNMTSLNVSYLISLSECVRDPLDGGALTFESGSFKGDTSDGGVLQITNMSAVNGTFVISSPASSNAQARWEYQLGYDASAMYSTSLEGLYWVDSDFMNSLFVTAEYSNFSKLLENTPYSGFVDLDNLNATTRNFSLFLHVDESPEEGPGGSGDKHKLVDKDKSTKDESTKDDTGEAASSKHDVTDVLGKSFCAMRNSALLNQNNADFSTTTRNSNSSSNTTITKGQFLFHGLNDSTLYTMQLGIAPAKDAAIGGFMFPSIPFHTKTSTSCQLIYNMTMCPETAFSVPGNASMFSAEELTSLYDEYVAYHYENFTQALALVNCHAKPENAYSVLSTCQDCDNAYRDWLCTVAVPRCEDWTNNASYLMPRPDGISRNNMINEIIHPGSYKEVLPCYWLCYNLVKYCPTSLGFMCPGSKYMNLSYGYDWDTGSVTCSYPGAVYTIDGVWRHSPSWLLIAACILSVSFI